MSESFEIVLLDTEFTAWEGSMQRRWSLEWEHREIIQVGAVRVRCEQGQFEEVDSLLQYIRPQRNPQLSDYIMALTGVRQEQVDAGLDFSAAIEELSQFCRAGQAPIWVWGIDREVFLENFALSGLIPPAFIDEICDLILFFCQQGWPADCNSGQVARRLGLQMEGHAHDALFDARSLKLGLGHHLEREPTAAASLYTRQKPV